MASVGGARRAAAGNVGSTRYRRAGLRCPTAEEGDVERDFVYERIID